VIRRRSSTLSRRPRQGNLDELPEDGQQKTDLLTEIVLDRGYHSNATMTYLRDAGIRSYAAEPDRGRRRWKNHREAQLPTYANRRRIKSARGKSLQRKRGELLERTFAHCLETGALRRVTTSSKGCSSTSPPSISASSCARKSAVGPRGDSRFLWLVSPFSSALFSTASWVISLSAGRAWAPPTGL